MKSSAYTEYAGLAIMEGIPVKFGTAHGRSRPEVGNKKGIDIYGSGGVTLAPRLELLVLLNQKLLPLRSF